MNSMLGLLLVVSAGALNGSYALPMKRMPRWKFENIWLVYSVVAMLVLNWTIALLTVPRLFQVFERAGLTAVGMVFVFGLIWGLGNLLFGAGIYLIGISLTFPICIGLSTALGSLIPMAAEPRVFLTPGGIAVTAGVVVLLTGVFVCALAGIQLDAKTNLRNVTKDSSSTATSNSKLRKGLAVVVLSGLCDPFLNFAFTFGDRVKQEAVAAGAGAGAESDAIWALALVGSFVVNTLYCANRLNRNRTWSYFRETETAGYWFLAAIMGVIWMSSITLYGRGASMLGPLGGSIGWALFYSAIIIFSTFWGVLAGEWREGRGRPLRTLFIGLGVLVIAIVILAYGNTLPTTFET